MGASTFGKVIEIMKQPKRSPWGSVDYAWEIAPGAWECVTPSHGGIKLSDALNRRIPARWRDLDGRGWYEEDFNWAIPFHFLGLPGPDSVPEEQWAPIVRATLERWHPDALSIEVTP